MASSHQNLDNVSPIIGILCMDIAVNLRNKYGSDKYSHISASYVKYLESAGAKVIPIWINRSRSYYEDIMSKINGILLQGGAVYLDKDQCTDDLRNDCVQSSKYIFEIAEALCKNGKHFPVWGICLGFQLMLIHSANKVNIRRDCKKLKCFMPIIFEDEQILKNSKIFGNLEKSIKDKMSKLSFGFHNHQYCITKDDLNENNIAHLWKVLAGNIDENRLEFITIVEHNDFPFFGSQIHPESTNDSIECFELTQYFAKFFVKQCNLNQNRFDDNNEILRYCIRNFPITEDKWFIFKNDIDYPNEKAQEISEETLIA